MLPLTSHLRSLERLSNKQHFPSLCRVSSEVEKGGRKDNEIHFQFPSTSLCAPVRPPQKTANLSLNFHKTFFISTFPFLRLTRGSLTFTQTYPQVKEEKRVYTHESPTNAHASLPMKHENDSSSCHLIRLRVPFNFLQ